MRPAVDDFDAAIHELSCRRCAHCVEAVWEFGGTRLGKMERRLLLIAGSLSNERDHGCQRNPVLSAMRLRVCGGSVCSRATSLCEASG
jgi:hypothetical protein